MMKKYLILFMLALLPLWAMAQAAGGHVQSPVKKQQTTTTPAATPTKKKKPAPAKKQTTSKIEEQTVKPVQQQTVEEQPVQQPVQQAAEEQPSVEQQPASHTTALSPILQNLIDNMVYVAGGTFTMGATSEQGSDAESDEKPAHQVTLSSFSIGKYEVTQEEWEAVMGSNPSSFKGAKRPVEQVSWEDCQEFIRKLNVLTGKQFRLPTEAEWEYAARGGNRSQGYKYAGGNSIGSNSGGETHPVGQKQANELGLYDMAGNVWEWCQDWYGAYSSSSQTNPTGPSSGSNRVLRGGCWGSVAAFCRVAFRNNDSPGNRFNNRGLRLAL